jgi:hypothetical protein
MRLEGYQQERLVADCTRKGGSYVVSSWLLQRMGVLENGLSCAATKPHIATLCYHDIDVLDPSNVKGEEDVRVMLQKLAEIFGEQHAVSIISSQPRLLYMPDAPEMSQKIIDKLVKIWPYKGNQAQKRKDVIDTLTQYPMLLVRMQFYLDERTIKRIQDLPVDIQNNLLKNYCG